MSDRHTSSEVNKHIPHTEGLADKSLGKAPKRELADVVIVEAVRTPLGLNSKPHGSKAANAFKVSNLMGLLNGRTRSKILEKAAAIKKGAVPKGALESVTPTDLGVAALKGLKAKLEESGHAAVWSQIEDYIGGTVTAGPNGQGVNLSRMQALASDLELTTGGVTVNRLCGSGLEAINQAYYRIASREANVLLAGGTEHMNAAPIGSDFDPERVSSDTRMRENHHQILAADLIARHYSISKEAQDLYSHESQQKYMRALLDGKYKRQIVPISEDGIFLDQDEPPRPDSRLDATLKVRPVEASHAVADEYDYRINQNVSAANASKECDGSAQMLLMSAEKAQELGLRPRAKILATATIGSDPDLMLTGPVYSTRKALEKAGLAVEDIDRWEINEAFAAVVLAVMQELKINPDLVNVWGGAIAHGHFLGGTGAMLMTKVIDQLEDQQLRYGAVTLCIGMGQGITTIVERL